MDKKVVIISDLHCGHKAGLTPPGFMNPKGSFYKQQQEMWRRYQKMAKEQGKVYLLVVNGDAIDGRGEMSGSRELWSVDQLEQCDAAAICIKAWHAEHVIMTFGTGYHTGKYTDYERLIADKVGADIYDHAFFTVNNLTFDCKHHVGSSTIPHGRHTSIAKEALWNRQWWMDEGQPKADIIIRSHVHYHAYAGDPSFLALTTPALQAAHSIYGSRRCSGLVHWGIVEFNVDEKGDYSWKAHTIRLNSEKNQIRKY